MQPMADNPPVQYVGFWARFVAFLVDSLLALLLLSPIIEMFMAHPQTDLQGLLVKSPEEQLQFVTDSLPSATVELLVMAAVLVVFWIAKSASPGKMVIRAVIADAGTLGKPSAAQCMIRYIGYFVSMFFFLGFFWIGIDARKQGWHDKLARTVVIRKPR